MLSRNENINDETPKENVFHMHRLARSEGMQMHVEAGEAEEGGSESRRSYAGLTLSHTQPRCNQRFLGAESDLLPTLVAETLICIEIYFK